LTIKLRKNKRKVHFLKFDGQLFKNQI